MSDIDAAHSLLAGIDWELLRQQKAWLLDVAVDADVDEDVDAQEGLLNLLDNIQDFAVDSLGLSEAVVFGEEYVKEKEERDGAAG